MPKPRRALALVLLAVLVLSIVPRAGAEDVMETKGRKKFDSPSPLAHEKYQLRNGLTVILHENHKLPQVAVNLWYHVGTP